MNNNLNEILRNFNIKLKVSSYGNGHINETFLCDSDPRYILQRINKEVFTNPPAVMENIYAVTEHLVKKIEATGGNPIRETMKIVQTIDGKNYYKSNDGEYYRMYLYVEDSITKETAETPDDLYKAAKAFGKFQNMLADFPADSLHETIVDFHNTKSRFEAFKKFVEDDKVGRAKNVQKEITYALSFENQVSTVVDMLASGEIPLRVTHNDTKLNNVLFDSNSDDAICVIDLDTVMPGSLLYDFGDALRYGASSGDEDERDLDKIYFDLEKFRAFTKGYLEELAPTITQKEIELLPFSVKLLTYECGIRFLGDYLNGDVYFRTHRENHNLDRARTQLKLVYDIEQKMDQMKAIVQECIKKKYFLNLKDTKSLGFSITMEGY